jgi:hypothetical protein
MNVQADALLSQNHDFGALLELIAVRTPIHVTACLIHERCLVVEESGSHYQRQP